MEKEVATPKSETRVHFALQLRKLRVARGFKTARSFAKALGIDENRYTRYERAEVEPDLKLIREICGVLSVTPNNLLLPHEPASRLQASRVVWSRVEDARGASLSQSDSQAKVNGHSPTLRIEALTWRLCSTVAAAMEDAQPPSEGDQAGTGAAMPLGRLQATTALYRQTMAHPMESIEKIVDDPRLANIDHLAARRIHDLCVQLAETITPDIDLEA